MNRRSRRNPEWKRGLRKGLLGLMLVLGAFFWRKNQEAGQQIRTGSESVRSAEADPVGRETKRLALTFDDGPHPYYTEQLLDGLADRGIKATFFLLGENIEGREDIIRRMHEEGHLIGNHTFYHVDVNSLPLKEACAEKILKVIIETCYLTDEEMISMCVNVTAAGADYIKTST